MGQVIMGIDCSYRSTGIAILKDSEILHTLKIDNKNEATFSENVFSLTEIIRGLIDGYSVVIVAMEDLNLSTNFKTSKILLRVHGAIML
ncbi:MAG: hypothetical protein DRN30_06190, partial [Thermoplasmata archaeon]